MIIGTGVKRLIFRIAYGSYKVVTSEQLFSSLLLPAGRQVTHWQSQWYLQVQK